MQNGASKCTDTNASRFEITNYYNAPAVTNAGCKCNIQKQITNCRNKCREANYKGKVIMNKRNQYFNKNYN